MSYSETVREILAQSPIADFRLRTQLIPSVTLGIAGYPEDATSGTALIRAADDAMFAMRQPRDKAVS